MWNFPDALLKSEKNNNKKKPNPWICHRIWHNSNAAESSDKNFGIIKKILYPTEKTVQKVVNFLPLFVPYVFTIGVIC